MPLAADGGVIARRLQRLCNGHTPVIQVSLVFRISPVAGHVANPGLMRIQTGQQRRACRTASAGVVKLREPQSVF